MDLPIVIALHHGTKYIQLMEMWSRACSRLIIVSPDFSDTQILSKAVDKGFLKLVHIKPKKFIPDYVSVTTPGVSVKHLPVERISLDPLPPTPLTRSRMVSWSMNFMKDIVLTDDKEVQRTRRKK